jgi:hypothetical protein
MHAALHSPFRHPEIAARSIRNATSTAPTHESDVAHSVQQADVVPPNVARYESLRSAARSCGFAATSASARLPARYLAPSARSDSSGAPGGRSLRRQLGLEAPVARVILGDAHIIQTTVSAG